MSTKSVFVTNQIFLTHLVIDSILYPPGDTTKSLVSRRYYTYTLTRNGSSEQKFHVK